MIVFYYSVKLKLCNNDKLYNMFCICYYMNFFYFFVVKLGIFCQELGKKHTFWHWERGRIWPQNWVIESLVKCLQILFFINFFHKKKSEEISASLTSKEIKSSSIQEAILSEGLYNTHTELI